MYKILVIDHDQDTLSQTAGMLADCFEVWSTTETEQILKWLDTDQRILVLASIRLRNGNGAQLLKTIKAQYTNIPVILTGDYANDYRIAEAALPEGVYADAFIAKPFEAIELVDCIEGILSTLPQHNHSTRMRSA